MTQFAPPPEAFNLNFNDLKSQVDQAVETGINFLNFVEKFSWFLPPQYKTMLDELLKILNAVNGFLDKTP